MKPGYKVQFIDLDRYLLMPESFIVKATSKKSLDKFIKKINKAWEELQ